LRHIKIKITKNAEQCVQWMTCCDQAFSVFGARLVIWWLGELVARSRKPPLTRVFGRKDEVKGRATKNNQE